MKTQEELLSRRRKTVEIVHELAFVSTLSLTIMFFWALGGKSLLWNVILSCFGAILEFTKKSQLELAAVTKERWERRGRKFVALVLAFFTLLSGLGAALNRTLVVSSEEKIVTDTSAIDRDIESLWDTVALQQEQQRTATKTAWRDDAASKEAKAREEIKALEAKKNAILNQGVGVERVTDMFALLAQFFRFSSAGSFMVFLLMLSQAAMELSFWVTIPQYWKIGPDKAGKTEEKPVSPQKSVQVAKTLPEEAVKTPLVSLRRASNTLPIEKSTPIMSEAKNSSQKPAIAERRLSERDLLAKPRHSDTYPGLFGDMEFPSGS